jgi:hypothetical protein
MSRRIKQPVDPKDHGEILVTVVDRQQQCPGNLLHDSQALSWSFGNGVTVNTGAILMPELA